MPFEPNKPKLTFFGDQHFDCIKSCLLICKLRSGISLLFLCLILQNDLLKKKKVIDCKECCIIWNDMAMKCQTTDKSTLISLDAVLPL